MTGKELNKILQLGAKQALYREDGRWYHNLTKFPGILFDKNGYVLFSEEVEYRLNSDLQIKQDLHIRNGLNSLTNYIYFTPLEKLYIEENKFVKKVPEKAIRVRREIETILRNQNLVDEIKSIYNNTCQICGLQLMLGINKYYSEVHHIHPIGEPHNGPDVLENMICVCPNCHILLDYKVLTLDIQSFKKSKHAIWDIYIEYHNFLVIK